MNRTITVAARKRDPQVFGVQKYDNEAAWNVPGGMAPNGVSATRWMRRTSPDVGHLSPLARFLVEHCRPSVAGKRPAFHREERVRCISGVTQAEMLRREFAPGGWRHNPRQTEGENQLAAENMIRCYSSWMSQPCQIDDWLFSIIEPEQSDEEYWDQEAARIVAAGAVAVEIDAHRFEVAR